MKIIDCSQSEREIVSPNISHSFLGSRNHLTYNQDSKSARAMRMIAILVGS